MLYRTSMEPGSGGSLSHMLELSACGDVQYDLVRFIHGLLRRVLLRG